MFFFYFYFFTTVHFRLQKLCFGPTIPPHGAGAVVPRAPFSHVVHVMRATAPRKIMCRGQFLQRTSDSSPQDIFELVVFLASLSLFGDDVDMYGPP